MMHLHINIYLLPQWGGINLLMKQSIAIVYTGAFRHITGPAKSHTPMNIYKLKFQPNSWISISENMTWNTGFLVINGTGSANGESIEFGDFVLFNNDGERFEVESGDEGLENLCSRWRTTQ